MAKKGAGGYPVPPSRHASSAAGTVIDGALAKQRVDAKTHLDQSGKSLIAKANVVDPTGATRRIMTGQARQGDLKRSLGNG